MARHYRILLFALFLFLLFYAVGFYSSRHDPTLIREVLGDQYVDTTERNIAEGNPFGIYASGNSFFMWLGIMINNIIFAFITFVKGLFLGLGSIYNLVKTAMDVGVFHYMFTAKGFGVDFIFAVMLHGLLELTAIVIVGGAGMIMGTSYLFPGTARRLVAFREGVKDGVKIMVGLVPVFMLAAFFEGFVTRHYKMPLLLNLLLLLPSVIVVIWYFMIYPAQLHRRRAQAGEDA